MKIFEFKTIEIFDKLIKRCVRNFFGQQTENDVRICAF